MTCAIRDDHNGREPRKNRYLLLPYGIANPENSDENKSISFFATTIGLLRCLFSGDAVMMITSGRDQK